MTGFDIAQIEPVMRSEHGDQRLLIELLRSDMPLCHAVRNYIADELENEPKKRFIQKFKSDLGVAEKDYRTFVLVRHAKQHLLIQSLGDRAFEIWDQWKAIGDANALDWLAERGINIDQICLNNAKGRARKKKRAAL